MSHSSALCVGGKGKKKGKICRLVSSLVGRGGRVDERRKKKREERKEG